MVTAKDVATYFIARADEDEDPVTNLKLQKLLYYAQGFHLAIFNKPLFGDPIEAWQHGPVVPTIYHEFKNFGSNPIALWVANDLSKFDEETLELLDEVYQVYGQYSALALRKMTHQESPWLGTPISRTISHELMKSFFKTRIVESYGK